MSNRPESSSISNLALAGVAGLFLVTVGVLGGLFYSLRSKKVVEAPKADPISVAVNAPKPTLAVAGPNTSADENAPVIRLALKSDDAAPVAAPNEQPTSVAEPEKPVAAVAAVAAAALVEKESIPLEDALRANSSGDLAAMKKDGNELLIPEMKGPSYTAKKAAANGGDAYAGTKPGAAMAKKPEPKKVIPPVPPVPPKTPVPVVPPKPATPAAPAKADPSKPAPLSAAELAKLDFSKAPVYVLKDGRRIRALVIKDDGTSLLVRNEVGAAISFKKTDIKETVK